MKKFISGLLLIALGVLFAPVSFASDGPETNKACEFVDYDNNHPIILVDETTGTYTLFVVEDGKLVIDHGSYTVDNKDSKINLFGLPSFFNWEALETAKFPHTNEWLEYKHELSFKAYSEPTITKEKNRTRQNC
jgi:hypothetical protein